MFSQVSKMTSEIPPDPEMLQFYKEEQTPSPQTPSPHTEVVGFRAVFLQITIILTAQ